MQDLIEYLKCFNHKEKEQLLKLSLNLSSHNSKKHRLLLHILNNVTTSDNKASDLLYNKKPHAAYYQLKKRLKEDVLLYMLVIGADQIPNHILNWQLCNRQIIQAQRLIASGLETEGFKLLKKAWGIAKKLEYHDMLLSIHETTRKFNMDNIEDKQLQIITEYAHKQIQLLNDQSVTAHQTERPIQVNGIRVIDKCSYTDSARCNFWQTVKEINQHISREKLDSALLLTIQLANVITASKSVQTPQHFWELARLRYSIYMLQKDYTGALDQAQLMQQNKGIPKRLTWLANEKTFVALFQLGNLSKARTELTAAKKILSNNSLQQGKYAFLEANLDMMDKHYASALKLLQMSQSTLKPLEEWYAFARILEMMVLFESKNFDLLDYRLDAFRKYQYHLKGHQRAKDGYRLINWLHRNGNKENDRIITNEKWHTLGPELINIEKWAEKY